MQLAKLAKTIAAYFISQNIIAEKDRQLYEYGLELIFADLFNFSCIFLLGLLLNQLCLTLLYVIAFVTLRSVTGGFHAKTYWSCRCGTIGTYIVFLLINAILPPHAGIITLGNILAMIPVIRYAPVQNPHRPISDAVRLRNRKLAILAFAGLSVISIFLCMHHRQEGVATALTLWLVSFWILPAIKKA